MPEAPRVSIDFARALLASGEPFLIRVEKRLPTTNRVFWQAYWDGSSGNARISAGRLGTQGQKREVPVEEALQIAGKRLASGFDYLAWTIVERAPQTSLPTLLPPLDSVRRLVWKGLDRVEAQDENGQLILHLTEIGARVVKAANFLKVSLEPPYR